MKQQSQNYLKLSPGIKHKTKLLPMNELLKTQIKLNSYFKIKELFMTENKSRIMHQQKYPSFLKPTLEHENYPRQNLKPQEHIQQEKRQKSLNRIKNINKHQLSQIKSFQRNHSLREKTIKLSDEQISHNNSLISPYITIDVEVVKKDKNKIKQKYLKKIELKKGKHVVVSTYQTSASKRRCQLKQIHYKSNIFPKNMSNFIQKQPINRMRVKTLQTIQNSNISIQKDLILTKKSLNIINEQINQFFPISIKLKKRQFPSIKNDSYTPWQISNQFQCQYENNLEQIF